jgi:CSLREA domain-containing protein
MNKQTNIVKKQNFLVIAALLMVLAVGLGQPHPVFAATFTVTKTADTNDGTCDADCSLREAIAAANAAAGADTVTVPAGTYTLSIAGAGEDANATGDLDITDDLTITGAGATTTVIDGNGLDRVFDVRGANVTFENVTIRGGLTSAGLAFLNEGAGIAARASGGSSNLTVRTSRIINNETGSGGGGAISIARPFLGAIPTLTIEDSEIANNTAENGGGGVQCLDCDLTLLRSTISGNTAELTGGVGFGGGGILATGNAATVTANLNRFVDNVASTGSGIYNNNGTVDAENNWWGCDDFPGSAGCDATGGVVDADPRLDLTLTATPNSIPTGGNSTLQADVRLNSDGVDVSPVAVLEGLNVSFSGGALGTISGANPVSISGGTASTTFAAGALAGFTNASATLDNGAQVAQIEIVSADVTPPVPPAAPADLVLQCGDDVPPPVDLTAVDDVDGPITVSPTTVVFPGVSPNDFVMVRTWTFTDSSGNSASVSQTITVSDTTAPVPPTAPADVTVVGAAAVPPPVDLTAIDNCDGAITVSPTALIIPGSGPNDFVLVRTWTFTDVTGNTSSISQTITVVPPNTAPVADDDSYSTNEDTSLNVAAPGVLDGDTDVDGDPLTAVLDTGPSNGTLTLNADGSFTYTPDANFNGVDSYTYEACDPGGLCDNATVTITVQEHCLSHAAGQRHGGQQRH